MRVFLFAAALLAFSLGPAFGAPAPLMGKWRIVAVSGGQALDPSKTHAEFAPDGRFASTVGCNRIVGKPTVSGAQLRFGPMMTTRMACIPPLDQTEQNYLAALEAVRGYRLEGSRLVFLGQGGDELVAMEREP